MHPLSILWVAGAVLSAAYVTFDAFTRNPELKVMKWGWVLVTLYTGVVGLALYLLTCREPAPGTHRDFVAPLWRQGFGSTIHCLAGDATGIVAAAIVTHTLGLPMWLDLIFEYVFGFAFGLLVFQALFMRDMAGGSYTGAVRATFLPEFLSMNGVMAGMIPVMVLLMEAGARSAAPMSGMHGAMGTATGEPAGGMAMGPASDPTSAMFWAAMSIAIMVGGAVAYPINVWLVAKRMKHGMGTVRALGQGGAPAPDDDPAEMAPMSGMGGDGASAAPGSHAGIATAQEVIGMTILSLVALGAGIVVAAVSSGSG